MLLRFALLACLFCAASSSAISIIDFRDVYFDAHQPLELKDLDPPSSELNEALVTLKHMPKVQVLVFGYADIGEGSKADCQEISERRALLVYEWLLANGVHSAQLVGHRGFGATQPIDFTDTEAQRRRNRRVELNVQ